MTSLQRILRKSELPTFTGLKRTRIDELIADGGFPPGFPLTDGGRAKGWLESDVVAWQQARLAKREVKEAANG